jgi:hypothetical protein
VASFSVVGEPHPTFGVEDKVVWPAQRSAVTVSIEHGCDPRAAIDPFDPTSIEIWWLVRMRGRVNRNPTTIALGPQKSAVVSYVHCPVWPDCGTVWATPNLGEGTRPFIRRDDGDRTRSNLDDEDRAIRESHRSLRKGQTSGQFSYPIRNNGSHRDDASLPWSSKSIKPNSISTTPPQMLQCRHQC